MENELYHWGIKGMKWGVRKKRPDRLDYPTKSSSTTRRVIDDYNRMSDQEFLSKYQTSKKTYAKRVSKYGDPYMNAPLAKLGKNLLLRKKAKAQAKGAEFAKRYVEYLKNETVNNTSDSLDAPYRQPIGPGAYASWPSKRAYINAEIDRVTRDQKAGRPFYMYDDRGSKFVVQG